MPGSAMSPPPGAQAALRAVRLLKLFTPSRRSLTLTEVARLAGLKKSTAHRLLRALQSEGLVSHSNGNGTYSLGPSLMALGVQALMCDELRRRARPMLKQLAQRSGETATLEVPVDDSMLILDEVTGEHVVGAAANIGTRWPIHATSTGKAFMAFDASGLERLGADLPPLTNRTLARRDLERQLEQIRRSGVAEMVDELEEGFSGVATVLRGAGGDVIGALSICGPTARFGEPRRAWLRTTLLTAAHNFRPG